MIGEKIRIPKLLSSIFSSFLWDRRSRRSRRMAVGRDRLSPQPVRAILALPFPFPIGPFLCPFPCAFLPSLSPVLAPFFIMPSLSSHIWFSMRHHSRICIGNRGRWSRLDITPADDAQDAKRQEHHEYLCDHSVFLTVFVSYSKFFYLSYLTRKSCRS